MSQPEDNQSLQRMGNTIGNVQFGDGSNVFTFAPVQIGTKIETQIIQVSVEKITQQPLIKASPYKGLKRFNFADRDRFFGRDALIARLFKAVNQSSLSLVLGASGSGKSSAVRAGLIPELQKSLVSEKFYNFVFTPNRDPFESFYRCLLSEEKDYHFEESEVAIAREISSRSLPQVIERLKKLDERWLIFIDQFEELFTNCSDPNIRQSFIEGLVQIANAEDSSVRIILAMRADFLEYFSFYPTLGAIVNQNNIHLVIDMYSDELRQAIEQPAARHGVTFEEGLVEQVIKEVQGQSGYLPLLQYTLNLLWDSECRELGADGRPLIDSRVLQRSRYNALEGIRGALQNRVNTIYGRLSQADQTTTKQIFLRMVSIVDTETGTKTVSRRAHRSEFSGQPTEDILNRFIDENLLVSSYENLRTQEIDLSDNALAETRDQRATVEIAHEILLSSWDALKRWLEEEKEIIILKNWLVDETRRWQRIGSADQSKAEEELLKGSRLEQIVVLREKNAFERIGGLNLEEHQFIDKSVELRDRLQRDEEERQQRELNLVREALDQEKKAVEQERKARRAAQGRTIAVAFVGLFAVGVAITNYLRSINSEILTRTSKAEALLASNQSFDGLIESLRAVKLLERWSWATGLNVKVPTTATLQQAIYQVQEQNRLQEHKLAVNDVSFSPDGGLIASASDDRTIRLWKPSGAFVKTLEGHTDTVQSIRFSPDGKTIVSGSLDKTIRLWNIADGSSRIIGQHEAGITDLDFIPNGKTIVSIGLDSTIKMWDLSGKLLKAWKFQNNPNPDTYTALVSVSPSDKVIASATSDGIVKLWDFNGKLLQTITASNTAIQDIRFKPNEKILASIDDTGNIKFWRLDGKPTQLKGFKAETNYSSSNAYMSRDGKLQIEFSLDGRWLAATSLDTTLRLWNLEEETSTLLYGHTSRGNDIAFSPDSNALISGSVDNTVRIWNLQPKNGIFRFGASSVIGLSPVDGLVAFSDLNNNTVSIKSLENDGKDVQLKAVNAIELRQLVSSPNNDLFAGANTILTPDGSIKGGIQLWNVDGTSKTTFDAHESGINSISFSADGKMIVSASEDKTVKLWQLTGKIVASFKGHSDRVLAAKFSPDGRTIASASADSQVKLWDLSGKPLQALKGHSDQVNDVSFSPDGKRLVSASNDSTVKIWDLNGEEIATLEGHEGKVYSVTYSPDGRLIASGGSDGTIRLWDSNGQELKVLHVDSNEVFRVSFSSDSKVLYSISGRDEVSLDTVTRWNLDSQYVQVEGCAWLIDYLAYLRNSPSLSGDRNLCQS